jgi:hypothetical protein
MPKWRQWEITSEADWIALEYAAEAIEQASMRWPLPLRQAFCIGSALPHTQRRWQQHQAPIGLEGNESVRDLRAKPGQQCAI